MSRLREQYENEIKDAMIKKFGYKNAMEIPKLDKIVVNMGVGEAKETLRFLRQPLRIWKPSQDRRQLQLKQRML